MIYQVDADKNQRWIGYQIAFGRFAWFWLATYLIVGLKWRWGLPVWFAVFLLAGYGWPLFLVRDSHRVLGSAWVGPAVVDRMGRYSRNTWAIWFIVSFLLTALLAYIGLSGRYGPIDATMVGLIVLFAVCTITFAFRFFNR